MGAFMGCVMAADTGRKSTEKARPSGAGDVTAAQHRPTAVMETLIGCRQKSAFNQPQCRVTYFCRKVVTFIQ